MVAKKGSSIGAKELKPMSRQVLCLSKAGNPQVKRTPRGQKQSHSCGFLPTQRQLLLFILIITQGQFLKIALRETETERETDVREKHRLAASCTRPDWGTKPTT